MKKIYIVAAVLLISLFFSLLIINLYLQIRASREQRDQLNSLALTIAELKTSIDMNFASQEEIIKSENSLIREQIESLSTHTDNTVRAESRRIISYILDINKKAGQATGTQIVNQENQNKRTLESLYNEGALIDRLENAGRLFNDGKYRQAYEDFSFVANEQPDNLEVQFFKFYSLFLLNKGDQSQYRLIKNGLTGLEKRGFTRPEIQNVLNYIDEEERASQNSKQE